MSQAKEPDYTVITSNGNIEVREYVPIIIAEVIVSGERKQAIREGFTVLADYIFGNNTENTKMDMTVPVTQKQDMGDWKVRFVMPKTYDFANLPKPNSKEIVLIQIPSSRFAVIRFSGLATDASIDQHTKKLQAYIFAEKLDAIGEPILAFYNPPWTFPFLRRNEVMLEIRSRS